MVHGDQPAQPEAGQEFSLVVGGPTFRLLRLVRFSGHHLELLPLRVLALVLVCWMPLLVLSAFEGQLAGGTATVPFLLDLEVHVRSLVALPLLIRAEFVVHQRMRGIAEQFRVDHLIPEAQMPRFHSAVSSARQLRDSPLPEAVLLILVYGLGFIIWRQIMSLDAATWYGQNGQLSWGGHWYAYVTLPVFQFFLIRWYFRLFIWARLLWRISQIDLKLMPAHPDRMGGLGFLCGTVDAFLPISLAHGALLAAEIANRIFYFGVPLLQFKYEVLAVVMFQMGLLLGPLALLTPRLMQAKLKGRREYGSLAQRYAREFEAKWLRSAHAEPLLGNADVQSMADLGSSYEVVQTMNIFPFSKDSVVKIVIATIVPVAPLAFTMISMDQLIKRLVGFN